MSTSTEAVHWAELTPAMFQQRRAARPIVYLPLGLCEPHGPDTPLGLDLIKAEHLCVATAKIYGGIVAPSLGFHIHECGPSAHWLCEQVGEIEPHLSSVGPTAMAHFLLHQMRALANAGFAAALLVSGHAGAHAADLTHLAETFAQRFNFRVRYLTDFELAQPAYQPDHAGRYELSLLWHLRPDLITEAPSISAHAIPPTERFALGIDATLADREWGRQVFTHLTTHLGEHAHSLLGDQPATPRRITFAETETLWKETMLNLRSWKCARPRAGQPAVPIASRWKTEEYLC